MADAPDAIVLERDRDLEGRGWQIWVRRVLLALICAVPVVALFNVFGQQPDSTTVVVPAASLRVDAPTHVRGGLLYQARFHVTARQELRDATLVLGSGWLDGMTVNTIEPTPVNEASDNGRLSLELGHIPAGQSYVLYLAFQVNPTNVGRRTQSVELTDGDTHVTSLHRTVTIYP